MFFSITRMEKNLEYRSVGIQVYEDIIYVTIRDEEKSDKISVLLLYNTKGQLQNKFPIEINQKKKKKMKPRGMAINNTYLYICDLNNHRVVVLNKDSGEYHREWGRKGKLEGEFYGPLSIYIYEEIWYVGDYSSIQLFHRCGLCLERIEIWDKENVKQISSICILQGRLCVSDTNNKKIRVFRPDIF